MKKDNNLKLLRLMSVRDYDVAEPPQGFWARAATLFRMPRRGRSEIDRAAARNRAVRLFSPTYTKTWNR